MKNQRIFLAVSIGLVISMPSVLTLGLLTVAIGMQFFKKKSVVEGETK
jgi:uncharacterized membrane-anchored protein